VAVGLFVFSLARGFVPFANNMSFLYIAIGALVACSSRKVSVNTFQWFGLALALLLGILFVPDRLMLVGKPVLLALLVFGAGNVPVAKWLLEQPVFQFVGKISYSLYLWQELFLGRTSHAPLAYLSWRFIEKPGIALGKAISDGYAFRPTTQPMTAQQGYTLDRLG
jgi:peptidoglycan/LPS O-acetylase OafA/YrhL